MNSYENYRRVVHWEEPDYIPMTFAINPACYRFYEPAALFDLQEAHPRLFPNFRRPALPFQPEYALNARAAAPYTDPWGCVWETDTDGIIGVVRSHPLADWRNLADFHQPDPDVCDGTYPLDWDRLRDDLEGCRQRGEVAAVGLPHGHTFLRLLDIRGYEDTLCDLMEAEPNILKVLGMVEDFNCRVLAKMLALRPELVALAEDLGMQHGPMLSPALFRQYIKPVYRRMMTMCREAGCMIHMHSDGDLHELVDDLIDSGVEILNLQDQVNGIDWIAGRLRGRVCIELDIDRQGVTRFGTPREVDELIRHEVETLGSRRGGLMMIFGLYPGMPLENVGALMDAMERYSTYFN